MYLAALISNLVRFTQTFLIVVCCCLVSGVWLFVNPWPVACQALLSMGFSRQEYWSELPFPSPGDLLEPGIETLSPALQVDSLLLSRNSYTKWKVKVKSCPTLCDPWTVAHQAPQSMGFSRQEYWSRLLFLSPGNLPDPGIELRSPAFQADALTSEPPGKPFFSLPVFFCFFSPFQCFLPTATTTKAYKSIIALL